MKKFLYALIIFTTLPAFAHALQTESPKKLATALHKANKEISKLFLTANETRHLTEYLEFFASWYAAVTPASVELRNSLSQQASDFIEKIKKIARPLERKPDRRLMGSSRLSEDGKIFYKKVIETLLTKLQKLT